MTQDSVNTSGVANAPNTPGPSWQRHFTIVTKVELAAWWAGARAGACLTLVACAFVFILWAN